MTPEQKTRRPFLAAFLSFLAPGLGQIYNGHGALGLIFLVVSVALPFIWGAGGWPRHFIGFAALGVASVGFWLFTVVHAFIQARKVGEAGLKRYQNAVVYAGVIIISLGSTFQVPWISFLGISPFRMATASMAPTVQAGDFLMVDPGAYTHRPPRRGDLIVFDYPRNPAKQFLMRVIALQGEMVEIKNKQVAIDGQPLQESYKINTDAATDIRRDNFGPLKIPDGHCFVLGDNRDDSFDSRYWGALPLINVKGQAMYVYWAKGGKRIGLTLK